MEELIRITNLLKVPIESIVTFPDYVEIISADQNVGSLPYIKVSNINTYDTSNAVLSRFRWSYIYSKNIDAITSLIYNLLEKDEDEIVITIGGYRSLYAKDANGNLICGITCSYSNGEWTIEKT